MDQDSQKIVLVTGASRGLGAALAEALGARGHHVIAVARTTGALEELDDRIRARGGAAATLAPMDVNEAEAMMQLAGAIAERWGGLDLWIHTAIYAAPLSPAGHVDAKDWTKSFATNATATQNLIGLMEPLLRARKGGRAAFRLHAPLVLHLDDRHLGNGKNYRPEIAAVQRGTAALDWPNP